MKISNAAVHLGLQTIRAIRTSRSGHRSGQSKADRSKQAQRAEIQRTEDEEGKRFCALNACTRGLTAQTILPTAEQAEAREKFVDSIVSGLKPVGDMEETLAQSITDTRFRSIFMLPCEGWWRRQIGHQGISGGIEDTPISP